MASFVGVAVLRLALRSARDDAEVALGAARAVARVRTVDTLVVAVAGTSIPSDASIVSVPCCDTTVDERVEGRIGVDAAGGADSAMDARVGDCGGSADWAAADHERVGDDGEGEVLPFADMTTAMLKHRRVVGVCREDGNTQHRGR